MGGFLGGLHFCKWPILGLCGFIDFIFVFHVLRVKSKYLLELLHLVYLYENSDYLTEGLGSRFIVQLVIVTWIVKCMLSTLDIMTEQCNCHFARLYKLYPFISIKNEQCKYFMEINIIKQCMPVIKQVYFLQLETS